MRILSGVLAGLCISAAVFAEDAPFIYDPHGARDPFMPLVTSSGAVIGYETDFMVSEMVLEGIIADGSGSLAIINGAIVEPGKMIGLYQVDRIETDRVVLQKDGVTSVLQLKKEE